MTSVSPTFDRQDLDLYRSMPMRFNGLVIETTNRCNARCGMCYQSSGPKGSDVLGKASLERGALTRCIEEAIRIPTLVPRFHLAGGEAFMRFEDCIHYFEVARKVGYLDITATTNAFWALDRFEAFRKAGALSEAGVTSLELSWDWWHKPYINPVAIANCLDVCSEVGIETNLRVLTTKSHDLHEALADIPEGSLARAHRITTGPVFATGRAAQTIPFEDVHCSPSGIEGTCHAVLNLTVNSFGDVFPCCAGFDQTREYVVGNIRASSILAIAEQMNRDPIIRRLVFLGASALLPILREAGFQVGVNFQNICHLCWTIFSNPAHVVALKQHADDVSLRQIGALIGLLNDMAAERADLSGLDADV